MLVFLIINFLFVIHKTSCLLCYNGTFTYRRYGQDPLTYRGLFGPSRTAVARMQCSLTIDCNEEYRTENTMCFVRSWSARARHAWIVQRGCYQSAGDDSLLRSMNIPTRAMTCKHEKHTDAEYKVCLCQADWCNSAPGLATSIAQYFIKWATYVFGIIVII